MRIQTLVGAIGMNRAPAWERAGALLCLAVALILPGALAAGAYAQPLPPVGDQEWGLKIIVFDVGQADAALVLARNGDAAVVDMGRTIAHGEALADYLFDPAISGTGSVDMIRYLFATHYDADHIGGGAGLSGRAMQIELAFDQGPSIKRDAASSNTVYHRYVALVGDDDGDGFQGEGELRFVRRKAFPGLSLRMGGGLDVELLVLAVNGNTIGLDYDLPLSPQVAEIDENPGSIALFVRYGHFEYLTCGDATSDDFKHTPDTEEALLDANAIPGGDDVDVFKVNHHGSDTSTGRRFIAAIRPEVAIVSSDLTSHRLPKRTTFRVLEEGGVAEVLVTGRATDEDGVYHESVDDFDDGYEPAPGYVRDRQGNITIRVHEDGTRYTVTTAAGHEATYSAVDADHRR